jgi:hypothetical protein
MRKLLMICTIVAVVCLLTIGSGPIQGDDGAGFSGESQKWILSVKKKFAPADVEAAGGVCEWIWAEAGIAVASSSSESFADDVKGANVNFAVPDVALTIPEMLTDSQTAPELLNGPPGFSAYDDNYQWYLQAIGAIRPGSSGPEWQLGHYTGSGVTIGIVDTGAPTEWATWGLHPEFYEFDPSAPEDGGVVLFWDNGNILNVDERGHGTMVASIIGAQHTGEGAMRGLAPKAKLYCYKCADADSLWMSWLFAAWARAGDDGVQILNNSWSSYWQPWAKSYAGYYPILFQNAAAELNREGVMIVAAAGNNMLNYDKDFRTYWGFPGAAAIYGIPQNLPNIMAIGGTGPYDYDPYAVDLNVYNPVPGTPAGGQKGRMYNLDRHVSNYIPWWSWPYYGSGYGSFVDIVAPMGGNGDPSSPSTLYNLIYLAVPYAVPGVGLHDFGTGTSFSSPIVCAVGALAAEAYYETHGDMPSPATLRAILKQSADDMVGPATDNLWVWDNKIPWFDFFFDVKCDKPGEDIRYGSGRVNAVRAIEFAKK